MTDTARLLASIAEVERVANLVKETQPVWSGHLLAVCAAVNALPGLLDELDRLRDGKRVPDDVLRYAKEWLADPDMRAQVKVAATIAIGPNLDGLIDEGAAMARYILSLAASDEKG